MSYIMSIDPGLRGCGVAIFKDNILYRADYVKNVVETETGYRAHVGMSEAVLEWMAQEGIDITQILRIAIEHPQIYPQAAQQKGDPNDLLDVVACGAAIAALFMHVSVITYKPHEWKGNVPKKIMLERIVNALAAIEIGRAQLSGHKAHNTLDAIGIGLYYLGRINRKALSS